MTRRILRHLLSAVLLLAAAGATAQTEDVNFKVRCIGDPAKVAQALRDAAANKREPDITGGKVCYAGQGAPSGAPQAGEKEYTFNSEITLVVEHAPEVDFDEITEPNPGDLVLFLDGKPLPGTHPRVGPSAFDADAVTTTLLTYRITHDVTAPLGRESWKAILTGSKSQKVMAVSTGLESGAPAHSEATILFTALPPGRAFLFALMAVAVAIIFFLVALRTGALRDKEPADDPNLAPEKRAYSLSRCQIAAWTVIVVLAYLFIWVLTGAYAATIPASAVTLMGISLTTYGVAAAVDGSKARSAGTRVCITENLVSDLVTGSEGASLHRLQFTVWTLALMVVFVVTAWRTLAMPDFDSTLLALMGISSGAYAGLKLPEKK